MNSKNLIGIVLAVLVFLVYSAAYVVDETEQAVVTQFGKVVGDPVVEPGLQFKLPFVQMVNYFPKNLQEWDGDPGQIPTLDKTYIWVDAFARWRIADPIRFFQTVGNTLSAQARLDDIIDPAIRNLVTSYSLVETVRRTDRELDTSFEPAELSADPTAAEKLAVAEGASENEAIHTKYAIKLGREEITQRILEQAQPKLDGFGIELVDVKVKRVNYVEQVRKSVYDRMIAERRQIAEKFRSEGKGEAQKIRGEKERELKRIQSEAYREAQKIKGEADGKVTRTLGEAYGIDPEFYSFQQTLESYKDTLKGNSKVVLSTDSEFLQYLKRRPSQN